MAWTTPAFSREKVNSAGRLIAKSFDPNFDIFGGADDYDQALAIINNWRSSHAYPLNTFQVNLRRSARLADDGALVAQRTKRLVSIASKLYRYPKMKLTQIQDIGGCRAVMSSADKVTYLRDYYLNTSQIKHRLATQDNYIDNPKESGYRGVHLVYRYFSDKEKTSVYNDLKIEIQIRSQYQHAWATAVETVGTFVREALKSSIGPEEWLRFFALMGSIIAVREGTALVPSTPASNVELVGELRHLSKRLRVSERLRAYGEALRLIEGDTKNASLYLLELDPSQSTPQLKITGFRAQEADDANQAYAEAERKVKSMPSTDAVLVSVDSLAALPKAYPNYFADTRMFMELLAQALSGKERQIRP